MSTANTLYGIERLGQFLVGEGDVDHSVAVRTNVDSFFASTALGYQMMRGDFRNCTLAQLADVWEFVRVHGHIRAGRVKRLVRLFALQTWAEWSPDID